MTLVIIAEIICSTYVSFFSCDFFSFVAVETINGTGVSGVDFEAKNETITVSPLANITLEIDIRAADGTCELNEKQFQMAIYDQNGASIIGSTVNITIYPDTQCGKSFYL